MFKKSTYRLKQAKATIVDKPKGSKSLALNHGEIFGDFLGLHIEHLNFGDFLGYFFENFGDILNKSSGHTEREPVSEAKSAKLREKHPIIVYILGWAPYSAIYKGIFFQFIW